MECQGKLAKGMRGFFVARLALHFPLEALKTFAEGEGFISLTQFSQQTLYCFHLSQRGANGPARFADLDVTGFHALEQKAFELATIRRSLGINITLAPTECRARLFEFFDSGPGFLNKRQPERVQTRGIIRRAQLHVGKNHPVAAQAAFQAQRVGVKRVHLQQSVSSKPVQTLAVRHGGRPQGPRTLTKAKQQASLFQVSQRFRKLRFHGYGDPI